MMFGKEILNEKQLAMKLGVSRSFVYKMLKNGLPYHQLGSKSRKYFVYKEVQEWLLNN